MVGFRLWLQERIAKLDEPHPRRVIGLSALAILVSLIVGPKLLAQLDGLGTVKVQVVDFATQKLQNPVAFKARSNGTLLGLVFQVFRSTTDQTPISEHAAKRSSADPQEWSFEGFNGDPGTGYVLKAKGLLDAAGTSILSDNAIAFSIAEPNQTVIVCGDLACDPGETAASCPADCDAPPPTGPVCGDLRCDSKETAASCPADCGTSAPPQNEPPPAPAPAIDVILPPEGAKILAPARLAATVANASPVGLIFDVIDPNGATKSHPASKATTGEWALEYVNGPGAYRFSARASLSDGTLVVWPFDRRFEILPPPPPPAAPATSAPPAATPIGEPGTELLSPSDSATFSGPVFFSARGRNADPIAMVFVVKSSGGLETLVLAASNAATGAWSATQDFPVDAYTVRARATFPGNLQVFSPDERRFAVGSGVPPAAPPPPPPAEPVAATTTQTLPPPPPPTGPPTPTAPPPPKEVPTAISAPASPPPAPAPTDPARTPATTTVPALTPERKEELRAQLEQPYEPSIPVELALECRSSGIVPDRCASWLAAKYRPAECVSAGASTREACAAILETASKPADEKVLFGMPSKEDVAAARARVGEIVGEALPSPEMPPAVLPFLAVVPAPKERWRVIPSSEAEKEGAAMAFVSLDSDGDGLTDDIEARLGTDPRDPDSDDDGFEDGMETRNGYNPLGAGRLGTPLRGVEIALTDRLPVEEPRGRDAEADPSLAVAAVETVEAGGETPVLRLSGRAAQDSVVTLFIYSYLPVMVTTVTDGDGNWSYDFGSRLADGRHEAYVAVNDGTGRLVASSNPLAFFVKEARAASEEDFLRPDVDIRPVEEIPIRAYVLGAGLLLLFALILTVVIVRQVRRSPMEPHDRGSGGNL